MLRLLENSAGAVTWPASCRLSPDVVVLFPQLGDIMYVICDTMARGHAMPGFLAFIMFWSLSKASCRAAADGGGFGGWAVGGRYGFMEAGAVRPSQIH